MNRTRGEGTSSPGKSARCPAGKCNHCGEIFTINLIPHTLENTTLKHLKAGSRVNLEVDLIARYCERLLSAERDA